MPTVRERLAAGERMTSRDLMAAALAEYYGRGPEIGARGDFYTASNVAAFPRALQRFVAAAIERLEGARVVELGGGSGALAAALGVPVTVVEPHEGLASAQRARGLRVVPRLRDLARAPSVVIANEVLDALPTHRILVTAEGLREGWVRLMGGKAVEEPGPWSSPEVELAAQRYAKLLAPGQAAEMCLDAAALLRDLAEVADPCIALFVDYGGDTNELCGDARPRGTLRGYSEHRVTDPFERPGGQDLTADVDFGLVEEQAREAGFDVLGRVAQGEFLADLGLLDDMMAALQRGDVDGYAAAKALVMPGGMGERFQAIVLGRGVPREPPLPGLRRDIMPGASRR